jgi:hypothetical protein
MNKVKPSIIFSINKNLEKNFFHIFSKEQWAMPKELHFLLTPAFKASRQKILSAYVDSYYAAYHDALEMNMHHVQSDWKKIAPYFFKEIDCIFKGFPWPKGSYHAHPSIWNMYPRFIQKRTFTFPSGSGRRVFSMTVIAHEMLHFITYDYLQKKYSLRPSESESKDNTFWQFTENLNVLIQNSPQWKKITKGDVSHPYPECKKQYERMKRIWTNNRDIDNLVKKILIKH